MRTFLAFRYKDEIAENEVIKNADLLKDYYQKSYLKYNLKLEYSFLINCGSLIIDDENAPVNFQDKLIINSKEIISYFPPLEVTNMGETYEDRISKLCRDLDNNKLDISNLTNPFLFSVLNIEKEEMMIYSDDLGLNRLYILKTEEGVFWSNRPSALLVFSQTIADIDIDSWKIYAASGWFMNERSPFKNIRRVKPGVLYKSKITDNAMYETIETNGIEKLVDLSKDKSISYESISNQMVKEIEAFNSLWKVPSQIDISGGIDSRVAAATIINSNVNDYTFRSIEDIDEEVVTAKLLLSRANVDKNIHIIKPLDYIDAQESYDERVMKYLFEFDGDFATVMINSPIIESNDFNSIDRTQVFGFGGEVSKGAFYSNQRWLDKLLKLGNEAAYYRLSTHFSKVGCVSEESLDLMKQEIKNVLEKATSFGFEGIKELDFFHLHERFRRWTPIGDKPNTYSPFTNKHFISLGLKNKPLENMVIKAHKNLIHEMKPEWDDIPFFKATPEQSKEKDLKNLRIWQTKDKLYVDQILSNKNNWNDVFIEDEVIATWKKAQEEGIPNFQETLFQRVVIRSLFNNHLENINKYIKDKK